MDLDLKTFKVPGRGISVDLDLDLRVVFVLICEGKKNSSVVGFVANFSWDL